MNDESERREGFHPREFLPGEDPEELTDTTPLITGGIFDSIATLKLVTVHRGALRDRVPGTRGRRSTSNTITDIASLVHAKKA